MSNYITPSQIAQRQLAYFENKKVLVAGEAEDLFPVELAKHCVSVSVFTTNYGYYRQLKSKSAISVHFGAELEGDIDADMVLLYWPKAKMEAEYLLAMLMAKLGVNTEIVVVGENRSGVKSIEKMFASLPGVFSHGEFDLGSRLLLDSLPKLSGKVLDFGCGAGVLGCVMATLNTDIQLEMCDISALAVRSSEETLKANQLSGRVFASDIYSDTASDYNFIVTNPPFHAGLDTS